MSPCDRRFTGWSMLAVVLGLGAARCAAPAAPPGTPTALPAPEPAAPAAGLVARAPAIDVPVDPVRAPWVRRRVASHLFNPRGVVVEPDGALLVATAGTGDPEDPNTGAIVRLRDDNRDGDYDDDGERVELLSKQPSKNILDIVRRDEVFGLADIARGDDRVLATLAFFGGPSTVFEVTPSAVEPAGTIHGNLNDIAFDPKRRKWFAVSSSSDEIVRFEPGGRGNRAAKLPPLAGGQDAVPGYLRFDPVSGDLIVSLFSGSVLGEAGGEGTEIERRAGKLVRFNPDTGELTDFVTGLTAPTDLLLVDDVVYVLELCDAFVEPLASRAELGGSARHGGFRRFSGRLLRVDRRTKRVEVVADELDAPTNLALDRDRLLVTQGMGTPGRLVPGPAGSVPLDGFIDELVPAR